MVIWTYGAKAPKLGGESISDQMRMAHRYRNTLVEIELRRRERASQIIRQQCPEVLEIDDAISRLDDQIDTAAAAVRTANQSARSRTVTAEQRSEIKALRAERKPLYARRKLLRAEQFGEGSISRALLDGADAESVAEVKAARAACGCYWGTYLLIEAAAKQFRKGTPPRFTSYRGYGRVGVQFQGGLPFGAALSGADKRLQLVPTNNPRWRTCRMRIGSNADRSPIWAECPVRLHRQPPDGAVIKWAWLKRTPRGPNRRIDEWSLQVVLDGVQPLAEQRPGPGFGAVAVDVGWRWLGDRLRVAYWVGLDGRCGELAIGEHDLDRWLYADVLQSEQDRRFDAMRAHIIAWRERVGPAMPDWLAEAFATLPKWRSTGRLAALCRRWGQERVDGDAELMPVLDEWMKRDCRLHTERSCLLKKAARWREDLYRQFAADLQNRYQTLLVEDADWRDLLRAPDVTDEDETNRRRRYARIASPGMMRQILRACGRAVKLASEYTTQRCGACGEIEAFDAAENLVHTCRHCGARWDQDENACRIMLGLHSGELAPASGPVA